MPSPVHATCSLVSNLLGSLAQDEAALKQLLNIIEKHNDALRSSRGHLVVHLPLVELQVLLVQLGLGKPASTFRPQQLQTGPRGSFSRAVQQHLERCGAVCVSDGRVATARLEHLAQLLGKQGGNQHARGTSRAKVASIALGSITGKAGRRAAAQELRRARCAQLKCVLRAALQKQQQQEEDGQKEEEQQQQQQQQEEEEQQQQQQEEEEQQPPKDLAGPSGKRSSAAVEAITAEPSNCGASKRTARARQPQATTTAAPAAPAAALQDGCPLAVDNTGRLMPAPFAYHPDAYESRGAAATGKYTFVNASGQRHSCIMAAKVWEYKEGEEGQQQEAEAAAEWAVAQACRDCPFILAINGWCVLERRPPSMMVAAEKELHLLTEVGSCSLAKELASLQTIDIMAVNPPVLQGYIYDALRGLVALHTSDPPIIHRDIRPSNILMVNDGKFGIRAKLCNLGSCARMLPATDAVDGQPTAPKSVATCMTTYAYSAPEVLINPANASMASDVFSLGLTAHALAVGELGELRRDWQGIPVITDDVSPPQLRQFLADCYQRDPTQRPSATQLLAHEFITMIL